MGIGGALVIIDAVVPLVGAEARLAHAIVAALGVNAIGTEVALVNTGSTLVKITAHETIAIVALFAATCVATQSIVTVTTVGFILTIVSFGRTLVIVNAVVVITTATVIFIGSQVFVSCAARSIRNEADRTCFT